MLKYGGYAALMALLLSLGGPAQARGPDAETWVPSLRTGVAARYATLTAPNSATGTLRRPGTTSTQVAAEILIDYVFEDPITLSGVFNDQAVFDSVWMV